ncbi:MAG: restriction endonuclease subunit S [Gemmatimonadota bacterium]|nr:restriction endonuclease subunit S [Gemmatimonadota bacterium]
MNAAWTWLPLRELTIRGATWNPRADPRPSIRYIDVSAVSRDELRIVSEATYSAGNAPSRARKIVEAGDTIFATIRPTLRRIAQIPESLDGEIVSTAFCVLRPDRHAIDADFLYFATQLESVMEGIAAMESGASYPAVRDVDVLDQVIPLPPLPEQREIAAVLNTIRTASLHQAQCEANATALKRAAMRTLFTRGLRGEAQKETGIGPVPESWLYSRLGDLAEIAYGAQAAVANATDPAIGTLILTNVNLDLEGHINLEKRRYYKIPEAQRERLSLRKGDVLFNWRSGSTNHVGKTVLFDLDGEYTYSSFILRFRPHRLVSNKYLFRWLTYLRTSGFFTSQRNVSSINSVYNASLSATIPVWFPDAEQQSEFVSTLDAIDRKIDLHRRKRVVLDELFKALLHKLMTGEIRVGDLDLSRIEERDPATTQVSE